MFVEDAELHGASASWQLSDTALGQSSRRRMCGQLHQPSIRNAIRDIGTIDAAITRRRAVEKRSARAPVGRAAAALAPPPPDARAAARRGGDRKSTRLNSSH